MDTIKQTMAALLGSWALSGCLTDPGIVQVPDTQEEADLLDQGDGDDDGTARLWPMEGRLPPVSPDMSSEPMTPGTVFLALRKPPTVDGPALSVGCESVWRSAHRAFRPDQQAWLL
ncbi:MAG: hypothetical protein IID40_01295 [Planctomycetes bacterium]|nr:hypothetical protein [Planctomycetota bacterium]